MKLSKTQKFYLCDYNDAYIIIRVDTITTANNNPTPVVFKNCARCIKCIPIIDGTTIDDAEGLDLVMLI